MNPVTIRDKTEVGLRRVWKNHPSETAARGRAIAFLAIGRPVAAAGPQEAARRDQHRYGLLPARNRRDFDDISPSARQRSWFVWLATLDDAVAARIGMGTPLPMTGEPGGERLFDVESAT